MPLALVSDIHGNDTALAAVVAELERLGIERVVCLGDAVQGGSQPREVLDRLAALGWPVILGNADDFLLEIPATRPRRSPRRSSSGASGRSRSSSRGISSRSAPSHRRSTSSSTAG